MPSFISFYEPGLAYETFPLNSSRSGRHAKLKALGIALGKQQHRRRSGRVQIKSKFHSEVGAAPTLVSPATVHKE